MGKDLKGKELGKGISQESTGLYSARFVDRFGKRKHKRFKKLQECRAWIADATYVDEHSDIYRKVNKELVSIEKLENKYDVEELKQMNTDHVSYTNSVKGKEILDHFDEYLPKFKKIIPNDYKKMMNTIIQMEEKGLNSEQAQIEAFNAIMKGGK